MPARLHDRIAVRAYLIWEANGCPHGDDLMHWSMAETAILAEHRQRTQAEARSKRSEAARKGAATKRARSNRLGLRAAEIASTLQ